MGKLFVLVALTFSFGCGDDPPPDCSLPPPSPDAGPLENDVIDLPLGCDPNRPGERR